MEALLFAGPCPVPNKVTRPMFRFTFILRCVSALLAVLTVGLLAFYISFESREIDRQRHNFMMRAADDLEQPPALSSYIDLLSLKHKQLREHPEHLDREEPHDATERKTEQDRKQTQADSERMQPHRNLVPERRAVALDADQEKFLPKTIVS